MESLFSVLFGFFFGVGVQSPAVVPAPMMEEIPISTPLRYLPLGDSYTIGESVAAEERWPAQLTEVLKKSDLELILLPTPARTGYTTQDLIDRELPVFDRLAPELVSLQIGVNDWVRGISAEQFRENFKVVLDHVLEALPADRVFVVTIPDFSKTPQGPIYGQGRDISAGIEGFNEIIEEESRERNLLVIDIFEISQEAEKNPLLTADDGLHPSAEMYALWVELIAPLLSEMLP